MGKKENDLFSKTVAAYDLEVGRCIELNNLMKLFEYQRSSHSLILTKDQSVSKLKSCLFKKTVGLFETKHHVKDYCSTRMKLYTIELCHITKMAIMPIYGKTPSKIFFRISGPFLYQVLKKLNASSVSILLCSVI